MPIKNLPIALTTIEIFLELIKVFSPRITKLKKLSETKKETSIIINKKQWNFDLLIQRLDVEKIVEPWIYRKLRIEVVLVEERFVCVKIN